MNTDYDIIVIGGGPAGFSAAIYAVRAGLKVLLLEKLMWGGQAAITPEIENYPGIESISGFDFAMKLHEQANKLGVAVDNKEVIGVELKGSEKKVMTVDETYEVKSVVIANGVTRRLLGCSGEKEYTGKGVSYCATCDGAFFREKDVALVGGGNTALEDAMFLSNHCRKVYLIHRRDEFRGDEILVRSVLSRDNIEVIYDSVVTEILGEDDMVTSLKLQNKKSKEFQTISVQGVFIAIGYRPDNDMYQGQLELTEQGYFLAGEDCHTKIDGVYVAGDCRDKKLRQIVTAAADGAMAGFEAANYCNTR